MLMTIDTAASLSCIRESVIPTGSLVVRDDNIPRVIGANGLPLQMSGHITLDVTINGKVYPHCFLVVSQGLPHDVLLGTPFLKCYVDNISLVSGVMTMEDGNEVVMGPVEETKGVVYLKGDTVLPAYQEVDTPAIVKGARGTVEVIEATPKTGNRSSKWRIANAITDISCNRDIIVRLANFGCDPVVLRAGTKVAYTRPMSKVFSVTDPDLGAERKNDVFITIEESIRHLEGRNRAMVLEMLTAHVSLWTKELGNIKV
jgi:hypothetical protein